MKILSRYIIKSFLAPFLATFLIILFVLIMQALWLQFDKIAGKGISLVIIFKFLGYLSLMMVPTALPIAILLSSIMTLGGMAENYELAAVKSAGISLRRFVIPLLTMMLLLSVFNYLFLNYVFPYASLKSQNLIYNMKMKEPSLALVAGTFNTEIPGYSIKFDEKYGEDENLLKNVLIYHIPDNEVNNKVITAEKGTILSEEGSRYLTLVLEEGHYYEDIKKNRPTNEEKKRMAFNKAKFQEYTVNIDISRIGNFDPDSVRYKTGKEMLSLKQLGFYIDSLTPHYQEYLNNKSRRFYLTLRANRLMTDSIPKGNLNPDIISNFEGDKRLTVLDNAIVLAQSNLDNLHSYRDLAKGKQRIINAYETEYHKRLAFSVACLVLFFIGAPLGSIIRKGGFGLPMIIAIIIFVIYFFLSTLGKNMAESNKISPFVGGWLATFVLLPFGLLLLKRATNDKGLFSMERFLSPINQLIRRFKKTDQQ
ncbi:MAG: LptF/LptG family permease [Lutimonas sp.]